MLPTTLGDYRFLLPENLACGTHKGMDRPPKKDDLIERLVELLGRNDLELLVARLEKERPKKGEPNWEKEVRTCPSCGHEGIVAEDFGTLLKRGIRRAQSWCRSCRNNTHYHDRPRKNRTR